MSSRIEVEVTEQLKPTRNGNGQMQVCGVDVGEKWPLQRGVYIANGEAPLKPGRYISRSLKVKGNELIVDLFRNSLEPVKA